MHTDRQTNRFLQPRFDPWSGLVARDIMSFIFAAAMFARTDPNPERDQKFKWSKSSINYLRIIATDMSGEAARLNHKRRNLHQPPPCDSTARPFSRVFLFSSLLIYCQYIQDIITQKHNTICCFVIITSPPNPHRVYSPKHETQWPATIPSRCDSVLPNASCPYAPHFPLAG